MRTSPTARHRFLGSLELPILALVCALLWGSAFPAIKTVYALWDTNTPPQRLAFAGLRFSLAGILLLAASGRWRLPRTTRGWILLTALALTQTFFQYFFFYSGLAVSSGILGSLLVGMGSFWWMLLAPPLLGTAKPTSGHWSALALGGVGVLMVLFAPGASAGNVALGGIYFGLSTLCGALGALLIRPISSEMDIRGATAYALLGGGLILSVSGSSAMRGVIGSATGEFLGTTIYLSVVSAAAFGLWNWLIGRHSINLMAGYRFLIPLCGATLSTIFLDNESPGWGSLTGGATILLALIWLTRQDRRQQQSIRFDEQDSSVQTSLLNAPLPLSSNANVLARFEPAVAPRRAHK